MRPGRMIRGWGRSERLAAVGIEPLDAFDFHAKIRTDALQATDDFKRIVGMIFDACKHIGQPSAQTISVLEQVWLTIRN